MNKETNIKTRVRFYFTNHEKPNISVQEYNQLKSTMSTNALNLSVGDIVKTQDEEDFKLTNIKIQVLEQEVNEHLNYGLEKTRLGIPLPYNFEVEVFFQEI